MPLFFDPSQCSWHKTQAEWRFFLTQDNLVDIEVSLDC